MKSENKSFNSFEKQRSQKLDTYCIYHPFSYRRIQCFFSAHLDTDSMTFRGYEVQIWRDRWASVFHLNFAKENAQPNEKMQRQTFKSIINASEGLISFPATVSFKPSQWYSFKADGISQNTLCLVAINTLFLFLIYFMELIVDLFILNKLKYSLSCTGKWRMPHKRRKCIYWLWL